jgi:ribose/xylose/arabinose/galactoside ABC-type transport system permease subunit
MELSYELAILAALILLMALITLRAARFLQTDNLFQIARNFSFIATVGVGEALVILTGRGGSTSSVGSVVRLGGEVATNLLSVGQPLLLAMAAGTAAGLRVGLVNGLLVTKARMTSPAAAWRPSPGSCWRPASPWATPRWAWGWSWGSSPRWSSAG